MKHLEPEKISGILPQAITDEGMEESILRRRTVDLWREITASIIPPEETDAMPRVDRGLLCVRVRRAPLRQELAMRRELIVARINSALGTELIRDIRFR